MVDMMESASVPTHRGLVHWQELLLAGEEGAIPGGGAGG